jgi:hypothetical protein
MSDESEEGSQVSLNRKTWKRYIRESKKDREWIVHEWISATSWWRGQSLKKSMRFWFKEAQNRSIASSFRKKKVGQRVLIWFWREGKRRTREWDRKHLKDAFEKWKLFSILMKEKSSMVLARKSWSHWSKGLFYQQSIKPLVLKSLDHYNRNLEKKCFHVGMRQLTLAMEPSFRPKGTPQRLGNRICFR